MGHEVVKNPQNYIQPWETAKGVRMVPGFFTNEAVLNVATPTGDTIVASVPDNNLLYVIDDIVVTWITAYPWVAATTATKLAFGVYGYNATAGAKDDADYFAVAAEVAAVKARGDTMSFSAGDFTWAATANTIAERTFRGGFDVRCTSADEHGNPTGTLKVAVRCHVVGAANTAVFPELIDEPDEI